MYDDSFYGCGCERPRRFGHDRLCPRYRSGTQQIADLQAFAAALQDALDLAERERISQQLLRGRVDA